MKYSAVQEALRLAREFIEKAERLEQSSFNGKLFDTVDAGKDSGAARRVSLDLTRALAQMRKPA